MLGTIEMKQSVKLILLVVLYGAQLARSQTVTDDNNIADYPYTAYLEYSGGSGNGAIISDTRVLTAASVVNPNPGEQIAVSVGNIHEPFKAPVFQSINYQQHPQYNATNLDNNVAVITIDGTFKGVPNVQPIAIRIGAFAQDPTSCFSIGWVVGPFSFFLRRVNYQLVTDQACAASALGPQPSTIQCAGAMKAFEDIQEGALPFVCDNQLYGILARSGVYSDAQQIDLYTKLTAISIREFLFPKVSVPLRRNYVSCA